MPLLVSINIRLEQLKNMSTLGWYKLRLNRSIVLHLGALVDQ